MADMIPYVKTIDISSDVAQIIELAQRTAYRAVDHILVIRNWLLGKRIAEEELIGTSKERYGAQIIVSLAKKLTARYGSGFDKRTLYRYVQFYQMFPEIVATVRPQSTEMQVLTSPYQNKLEFIRNPVIAEFLGMEQNQKYHESDLEQTIINNLQKFMMELGKGYAFVARQQHIHTEKDDYYIDLVFYNYILKCFVLIDLKNSKITHQDVGQMDMYIRMYDDLKKRDDDNPTLGLVLCTDTDEDIAKYSVLHGNEQLFASKYKLYLPTDEELRAEIETQKQFFLMQQAENEREE